ncbi:MAG: MotA/TolQ/ExbB proton channel family protein [Candidatus Aureabacteria bacterium]|nr:MotA/TolQ/ExbB proton channel family protein [Candidatus Auribacterota bacterium]
MKKISPLLFFILSGRVWGAELPDITEEGMTLWQLIENGGWVMIVLGVLSVLSLALILFFFATVRHSAFVPSSQLMEVKKAVESKDVEKVKMLCKDRKNFLEKVVYTGASNHREPVQVFRLKMEDEARRFIELHWQRIGFLSDIAVISPMLGLLGTVLGMIKAFNAIAFRIGEVKPIFLAYGVSQAMVTTAAGLIVGIFSMVFYYYFRVRIQNIAVRSEMIIDSLADYFKKS